MGDKGQKDDDLKLKGIDVRDPINDDWVHAARLKEKGTPEALEELERLDQATYEGKPYDTEPETPEDDGE